MEINKQLFEDVLSGKLKGTFVLWCKQRISSTKLIRNNSYYSETHPYGLCGTTYTPNGLSSPCGLKNVNDIVDFIPETDMKENELIIEIPQGKEIDWDESKKQNKIVLKNEQLTYEDVCDKLFKNREIFYTNNSGDITKATYSDIKNCIYDKNNAITEHQLECILAKNKLATIAVYLNDGWKHDCYNRDFGYFLCKLPKEIEIIQRDNYKFNNNVIFKSKETAQQAIEILGEETIKLALEPLGI